MLDRIDYRLIALAGGDIGESLYPFSEMAAELEIGEQEVISRLRSYRTTGTLRRFGAILRHQQAGFQANGMSVWNVAEPDTTRVGRMLAECPEISHCYERPRFQEWQYNIYAMIHGRTKEDVTSLARRIAEEMSIDDYLVLFSVREFKKTSMMYLEEPQD